MFKKLSEKRVSSIRSEETHFGNATLPALGWEIGR